MNQFNLDRSLQASLLSAQTHVEHGDWKGAIECYERVVALFPTDANALIQLSYVHSLAGHYRTARKYTLRAYEAKPEDSSVLEELVARLHTFEPSVLNECIKRMLPLTQVPTTLLLTIAAQLSYLNKQDQALECLQEAQRRDKHYPPTLMALGQVLTYLGRLHEAEAALQQAVAHAPRVAQGHWLLSMLRTQNANSNHVDTIRSALKEGGWSADDFSLLAFALHKELDDLGEYKAAWTALEQGCGAKRSRLNYRSQEAEALVGKLINLPPPAVQTNYRATVTERVPIFIVGMHRSGTTLLEHLLSGHGEINGIGELYDFTRQMRYATDHHCRGVIDPIIVERAKGADFKEVGRGYLAGIEWRLGTKRFFTDKLPSNFLNIGFICQALPQAKILHMVRDPIETCFSNLRELFSDANPYSYDQIELADYIVQYLRLMRHWRVAYPGRILDVHYAELTRDPERVLRAVSEFCGFEFEPAMLDMTARTRGVATASAVQVREKVVARDTPKWLPYAEYLQPMIQRLRADGAIS